MGCASSSEIVYYDIPQPPQADPQRVISARPLFEHSDEYPDDEAFIWRVMWKTPPALNMELAFPGATTHYAKRWVYFQELLKLIESTPGAFAVLYHQAQRMAEDLARFEGIQDPLLQLAQTGYYFDLVFRFNHLLDNMFAAYGIPTLVGLAKLAANERKVRVEHFRALLKDDARMRAELSLGTPDMRSFELLTLIKYNYKAFAHRLLSIETQLLVDAYERIAQLSRLVLVFMPDWFRPTDELLAHYNVRTTDLGDPLQTAGIVREEPFEVLLLRSEQMARRARGFDIDLVAASYVGEAAYLCEPVIPESALAILRLENAPRWLYLWQIAQAIESLHDRGLAIGSFSWYHVDLGVPGLTLKLRSIRYAVPLPSAGSTRRDAVIAEQFWPSAAREPPSTAWDVFCLGKCIFELLRESFEQSNAAGSVAIEYGKPLPSRPSYIHENEWQLIQDMCAPYSSERPLMADVVHRLYELMVNEATLLTSPTQARPTVVSVDAIDCAPFSSPIVDLLQKSLEFINSALPVAVSRRDLNAQLYTRFSGLYTFLVNRGSLPKQPAERLGGLAVDFLGLTQDCTQPNTDEVFNFVAYHAQIEMYLDIHHGLDECLAGFGVPRSDAAWGWRPQWEDLHSTRQHSLLHQLQDAWPTIAARLAVGGTKEGIGVETTANETLSMVQFELTKRRYRYDGQELALLERISLDLSERLHSNASLPLSAWPEWFIPAYELNCATAVFGAEPGQQLDGKWRGRAVSVRIAADSTASEQIASFVETTYVLNHPNMLKILGGWHVGTSRRFIVRNRATSTLADLTRDKDAPCKWKYLLDVARCMDYLHSACVAVMDLSASFVYVTPEGQVQVSIRDGVTPRWAAPERLEGGPATAYSDIYAFGMCVLEVLSGDIPWGSVVADEYVVNQVRQGNLPSRPENVVKDDWALIRRLCCKDPAKRVGLSIVITAAIHAERNTTYTVVS